MARDNETAWQIGTAASSTIDGKRPQENKRVSIFGLFAIELATEYRSPPLLGYGEIRVDGQFPCLLKPNFSWLLMLPVMIYWNLLGITQSLCNETMLIEWHPLVPQTGVSLGDQLITLHCLILLHKSSINIPTNGTVWRMPSEVPPSCYSWLVIPIGGWVIASSVSR